MSNRTVRVEIPEWWPPKVGDRLRSALVGTEYLLHVVSVFQHDNKMHVVAAYYGKHKQWWHYEVISSLSASTGSVWPDGQERPEWR